MGRDSSTRDLIRLLLVFEGDGNLYFTLNFFLCFITIGIRADMGSKEKKVWCCLRRPNPFGKAMLKSSKNFVLEKIKETSYHHTDLSLLIFFQPGSPRLLWIWQTNPTHSPAGNEEECRREAGESLLTVGYQESLRKNPSLTACNSKTFFFSAPSKKKFFFLF